MIIGKAACGLQYAVRRSGNAVGYCSLTIKSGTRDEGNFHSGIAHFTEHTMFKGTCGKSSRVINGYLDKLGGDLNAFTTKEEIVLHATVLKEDLGKAASLLLELATCPTFPKEQIDIERGVVVDEIISYKDSPADDIYDKFEEALFEGHPLGKPILGTAASVKKITSDELKEFVRERFTPGNMALAIVADVDEKKMEAAVLKLAEKIFDGHWLESKERLLQEIKAPKVFNRIVDKKNHEVNAIIGGLAPSLYDKEGRFSAILLSNIIGGPVSNSMLNNLLREKNGWVYGVESSYTQYTETGLMAITFGCDKCNLEKCMTAVRNVIGKMQEEMISGTRLKAAKKQLLGQLAISSDNGETQCLFMGKSLISFGTIFTDRQNREAIEEISAESLLKAAQTIFDPQRISTLIFL